MKIYLDVIFFANFFGDFLCLCLTGAIYRRTGFANLVSAALIGGLYGTAAVLPHMGFLSTLPFKAAFAVIIAFVAYFPTEFFDALRAGAVFGICGFMLCGAVRFFTDKTGSASQIVMLICTALILSALSLLRRGIYSRYLPCVLCFRGKKYRTYGFYDSGNRLFTHSGSMPVIVADDRTAQKLFGKGATGANLCEYLNRDEIITIPFCGASGGELSGVRLDFAVIGGRKYRNVALGFAANRLGEKIILHSAMI